MNPSDVAERLSLVYDLLQTANAEVASARTYDDNDPRFSDLTRIIEKAYVLAAEIEEDVRGWIAEYEGAHEE